MHRKGTVVSDKDVGSNRLAVERLRVLFAGGCHVGGFPVGQSSGFPAVANQSLQDTWITEVRVLPYVNLSRSHQLSEEIHKNKPDVLVLQVGHYECQVSFRKRRHRKEGSRSSTKSISNLFEGGQLYFKNTLVWNLRARCRVLAATALACLGYSVFDEASFSEKVNEFFRAAAVFSVTRVLVLSPFPSIDPLVSAIRRRAGQILREATLRNGFEYVEVGKLLMRDKFDEYEAARLFADSFHLSREGHLLLGKEVAIAIKKRSGSS